MFVTFVVLWSADILGSYCYLALMSKPRSSIGKLLIANRGEIAIRIMKSAQSLGIRTVAIYSEADVEAPHRFYADESYLVGASPSSQSYLKTSNILDVAKRSKCDAIHPGYGFLSENATFAEAVSDAGLIFIGPSAYSMKLMGDKLAAKRLAKNHKIPLVPGSDAPLDDLRVAQQVAANIEYPILLKAAGGGGGKGMRIVYKGADLNDAFRSASREAEQSFGDPRVFIERYLESPRHIEVQVMADHYGNVVHLFERDCSIQRRHQKVIEESPAPHLSSQLRDELTQAAIKIARACKYTGAGTLEFLVDEHERFYFLEMNTRLQVEHPVTEMVTGIDLVTWQINIAQGLPLPMQQEEINQSGHSIELRVYAEDPLNRFSPSLGILSLYQQPQGEGIRIDSGVRKNYEIPIYYDPLLSKLIVWSKSRPQAITLLNEAIKEYHIGGIKTTLELGNFVMEHPAFVKGRYDTNFIDQYFDQSQFDKWNSKKKKVAAIAAVLVKLRQQVGEKQIDGYKTWWSSRKWVNKSML